MRVGQIAASSRAGGSHIDTVGTIRPTRDTDDLKHPMNYYYLKIGEGNVLASDWLSGKNTLGKPAAVIFFDLHEEAAYVAKSKDLKSQARDFYECGLTANRENSRFVVIFDGNIWILKPAGGVQFLRPKPEDTGGESLLRKAMPVDVLATINLSEAPLLLAGMPADQYLCRGTFRRIGHWGNLKALDMVLKKACKIEPDANADHWKEKDQTADQLLECLGSTGLETLVARIFEEAGCFVPARTGGSMKDIDLFAHNDRAESLTVGPAKGEPIVIEAGKRISLQVKMWPKGKDREKSPIVDALVGIDVKGPATFDSKWILATAKRYPATKQWLARSLDWLPQDFRKKFDLDQMS